MQIIQANRQQAPAIARLIMMAMTDECCQNLTGPRHSLAEFETLMTRLVERDDTQYSYANTLVAVDSHGNVAGVLVSYDGARLHELRQPFIDGALEMFGMDHHGMEDEAQPDELYLDSLAVDPRHRGKGIARQLLMASRGKARQMGIGKVGLLVDKGNPRAEALYRSLGFEYVNDASWGGHPMKHLQYSVDPQQ